MQINVTCDEIYLKQRNCLCSHIKHISLEPSLNTGLQISIYVYGLASETISQCTFFFGLRKMSHIMLHKISL